MMSDQEITAEFAAKDLTPPLDAPRFRAILAMGAKSDLGRARENNEDKFDWLEPDDPGSLAARGRLYAVADGMGGHAAGQIASEVALKTLLRSYYASRSGDAPDALAASIRAANALVWETGQRIPGRGGMGTTVTALAILEDRAVIGQVGDSRLYLLRDGEIKQVTEDHSWVAEQVKAGILTEEEAESSPFRNVITRSIGAEPAVSPDLFELKLKSGDRFLLCSDGLSGPVKADEMKGAMESGSPSVAAQHLIDLANDRGGPDNVTCMILRIDEILDSSPDAEPIEEANVEPSHAEEIVRLTPDPDPSAMEAAEPQKPSRRKGLFGLRR